MGARHLIEPRLSAAAIVLFMLFPLGSAPSAQDVLSRPVVYRLAGMDSVQVQEGVAYKRVDGTTLTMNVASPSGGAPASGWPVVIFIHGGPLGRTVGRQPTDWGVYRSYVRLAAASGLLGVSFNFRYYDSTKEGLALALSDVADAISYVEKNAATLRADPRRICLWAFSGGGPMLALALRGKHEGIRCLVSYYAILDTKSEVGTGYSPATDPLPQDQTMPPIFIARAGLDSPGINKSVDAFVSRAQAEGFVFTLANHPTGRHGFDILDDDERSREIIASTFDFIRAHTTGAEARIDTRLGRRVATLYDSLRRGDFELANRLSDPAAWPGADAAFLDRVASEYALNSLYYQFAQEGMREKALGLLEWLVQRQPRSATALDRLAAAYETAGRKEDAKRATEKELQLLDQPGDLSPDTRTALRKAAADRLKRLSGGQTPFDVGRPNQPGEAGPCAVLPT